MPGCTARKRWKSRHERAVSAIRMCWNRKRVRLPARWSGKRIRLHFEATDYYADTWVNGRFAGRHEGYIDPYEYDVSALVKAGDEAEILVRTWTPVTSWTCARNHEANSELSLMSTD